MGSDSGGDSTVTNKTTLDPQTQQWRQTLIDQGGQLHGQGAQVVPFSNATNKGRDYIEFMASSGAPGNAAEAHAATSRGLSGYNPAMPFAQSAAQGGLAGNPATQQLQQFGQGQNPHLQSLFNQGASQIGDAVNANFMQAGRFGPNAAHSGAMTRELGNLWTNINMPAYENERNRGLSAAQTMGSLYDSGQNRTLAGAELMGGLHSASNQDAMRAQALMPSMYQYNMMPGQSLLDIGAMQEGQAQRQIDAPWDNLQRYSQIVSGMPNLGSSTTTTSGGPGQNRAMTGMGGAMAGAQMGSMFGPWGTAIGAIGGGLYGAFG